MKKKLIYFILLLLLFLVSCNNKEKENEQVEKDLKETKKVFNVGISQIVDHPALNDSKKGFIDALKANKIEFIYDDKIANNDFATQNMIMNQFASEKKDLIYAITTPTAQAAANQISDIPIIFGSVSDPKGAGLEGKLNVAGSTTTPEFEKNLELIHTIFPEAKKIGILYNSSEQNSVYQIQEIKKIAEKYNMVIIESTATNASEIMTSLEKLGTVDVFYAIQDSTLVTYFDKVVEYTNNKKIPIVAANDVFVSKGALISEGHTDYDIGYKAGEMAAALLKGEKTISELGFQKVLKLKRIVNKTTMEKLGIQIPEEIMKTVEIIQ